MSSADAGAGSDGGGSERVGSEGVGSEALVTPDAGAIDGRGRGGEQALAQNGLPATHIWQQQ